MSRVIDKIKQQAFAQDGEEEMIIYLTNEDVKELTSLPMKEISNIAVNPKDVRIVITDE